jgi:inner membrane protein
MNVIETITALETHWYWFALAALLAIMEIAIAPGIFLIFIAIAAALTGFATMLIDFSLPAQLIFFAISSIVAVYAGRQWYLARGQESADPLLNDRAGRMVGQTVTVIETTSATGGRVRVGDSDWPAFGEALKVGAKGRIKAVIDGKIELEAAD